MFCYRCWLVCHLVVCCGTRSPLFVHFNSKCFFISLLDDGFWTFTERLKKWGDRSRCWLKSMQSGWRARGHLCVRRQRNPPNGKTRTLLYFHVLPHRDLYFHSPLSPLAFQPPSALIRFFRQRISFTGSFIHTFSLTVSMPSCLILFFLFLISLAPSSFLLLRLLQPSFILLRWETSVPCSTSAFCLSDSICFLDFSSFSHPSLFFSPCYLHPMPSVCDCAWRHSHLAVLHRFAREVSAMMPNIILLFLLTFNVIFSAPNKQTHTHMIIQLVRIRELDCILPYMFWRYLMHTYNITWFHTFRSLKRILCTVGCFVTLRKALHIVSYDGWWNSLQSKQFPPPPL